MVPSDTILKRGSGIYRFEASKPGLLPSILEAFADQQVKQDVKLVLDGKEVAVGFGKVLGEEDLGGFEEKPTLVQRQDRLTEEMSMHDAGNGLKDPTAPIST